MKKNRIILIMLVTLFIVLICLQDNNESMSINEVLNTNNYSYLPEKAKEYIKYIYEDTGTILRTEQNKIINQPYLNPDYVTYLSLTAEEQKEYDVIPETTLLDYTYSNAK